jgi:hypothetical protein
MADGSTKIESTKSRITPTCSTIHTVIELVYFCFHRCTSQAQKLIFIFLAWRFRPELWTLMADRSTKIESTKSRITPTCSIIHSVIELVYFCFHRCASQAQKLIFIFLAWRFRPELWTLMADRSTKIESTKSRITPTCSIIHSVIELVYFCFHRCTSQAQKLIFIFLS